MKESVEKKCCCHKPANRLPPCSPDVVPNRLDGDATSTPVSAPWIVGRMQTAVGEVPQIGTSLGWADCIGGWKVRWAIGRMRYRVPPGLYAVGSPNDESPVLVTANYKLTFDRLRSQLAEHSAWVVVLERTGFRPVFGPVYATDLPAFLDAGMKTPEMRFVHFPLRDRLAVVPVEVVQAAGKLLIVAICFFFLAGLGRLQTGARPYSDCVICGTW